MVSLLERYESNLVGVLACFDRIVITGTIPGWCYAQGMASYLTAHGIRLFDFAKQFAEPLRDEIRANAERIAKEQGLSIEFIRNLKDFRKEDHIKQILEQRGTEPGLVHIFSAMETCTAYAPRYHQDSGTTTLVYKTTKCIHYYFYFIDAEFGLCYLRVPTWAPFRLQFYCNGHSWLAAQLRKEHIDFTPLDNTFTAIADLPRAQVLADHFPVERLHHILDILAQRYCPAIARVPDHYHWSLMQVEYSTDLIFKDGAILPPLYETLISQAIHLVKPDHIAKFLGKKLDGRTVAELGTEFRTRPWGTCLKHYLGWASIKMYDKYNRVLRLETTINNVTELKHYRTVEHQDGTTEKKYAPMQKTMYSLPALRELLNASNQRYLEFLSDLEDSSEGQRHLTELGPTRHHNGRAFRGFNLFQATDLQALLALLRGEGCISGITNPMLQRLLPDKTSRQISNFLQRCRIFGLLKKAPKMYKYYVTKLGRRMLLSARQLQEFLIIPTLAGLRG